MTTTVFLLALSAAAIYLAMRWRSSIAELAELRKQVASLKRQLRRVTRTG